MYYVYGLVDPTNNMVSYIGITGNTPHQRFVQHIRQSERDIYSPKGQWMNSLFDNGYIPIVVTLQTVDTEQQAQIAERWWIAHGQMIGWPLRNSIHFVRAVADQPSESQEESSTETRTYSELPFPIEDRPLTSIEASIVRDIYAAGTSKNKVIECVWGSQANKPKRLAWLNQALEGGAA